MYTRTFTLKQHTPIIHFQHDQDGATLRASEVKPKLDRYIIEILGLSKITKQDNGTQKEIPKDEYKYLFINNGKDHLALDYKMRIVGSNNIKHINTIIIPPNEDKCVKDNEIIKLTISTYNIDIINKLSLNLNLFFILNNFGKRQSKGFGCFYTIDTIEEDIINCGKTIYKYNLGNFRNTNTQFYDIITRKWRELKSGHNLPGSYKKSQIFKYMFNKEMRWDKRFFKIKINELIKSRINKDFKLALRRDNYDPIDIATDEDIPDIHEEIYNDWVDNTEYSDMYFFGRAMLGLAEHYEFMTTDNTIIYKIVVKSDNIERFKSPIIFKIFNNSIYSFIDNEITSNILNKKFTFDLIKKNRITKKDLSKINNFCELNTPLEFSLEEFIENHFEQVNFEQIN